MKAKDIKSITTAAVWAKAVTIIMFSICLTVVACRLFGPARPPETRSHEDIKDAGYNRGLAVGRKECLEQLK